MSANCALPSPAPEFRKEHFVCDAGERSYLLYVPASIAEATPRGLIVMLHGALQSPEDFATGTGMNALAQAHGLLVPYPAQTSRDNLMSSWNWFRPGDQRHGAGEPAIIAGITESLMAEYKIPPNRVFVAGLSAGGAMAAILGEAYPELYAAVGVHSGLARGSANDVFSAFAAMRGPVGSRQVPAFESAMGVTPRMIVFHGSADTTVHPSNADRILAGQAARHGKPLGSQHEASGDRRAYTRFVSARTDGARMLESWTIEGARHAWSGGQRGGSYTDPRGPDASAAMVCFFLDGGSADQAEPIRCELPETAKARKFL